MAIPPDDVTRPEPEAFSALAEEMAGLGVEYLKKIAGIEVSPDPALEITRHGIRKAIELFAPDHVNEVKRTIEQIRTELKNHLVSTN